MNGVLDSYADLLATRSSSRSRVRMPFHPAVWCLVLSLTPYTSPPYQRPKTSTPRSCAHCNPSSEIPLDAESFASCSVVPAENRLQLGFSTSAAWDGLRALAGAVDGLGSWLAISWYRSTMALKSFFSSSFKYRANTLISSPVSSVAESLKYTTRGLFYYLRIGEQLEIPS